MAAWPIVVVFAAIAGGCAYANRALAVQEAVVAVWKQLLVAVVVLVVVVFVVAVVLVVVVWVCWVVCWCSGRDYSSSA